MGMGTLAVAVALAIAASGCLGAPPGELDPPEAVGSPDGGGAGPGATPDGAASSADAGGCADAFAVAYTSQLDVRPTGGQFVGVLVIAALGAGVDLTQMNDAGDDSTWLELELAEPNYDLLPPGDVSGELAPDSAALIVGPLVSPEDWTQPATPSFRLRFSQRASEAPPPHRATAKLRIGGSAAALDFDLTYVAGQTTVAAPRAAAMVYSVCSE